jgi:hypothetical protein
MQPVGQSRWRSLAAGAVLVLTLAALGIAVHVGGPTGRRPSAWSIELPYEEPPRVPPGPNVAQFTAYCRLCHSPRLVLTQPRLTGKRWGEVVRKMVTVYGAPIPPSQEPAVVEYLTAVRGPAAGPP